MQRLSTRPLVLASLLPLAFPALGSAQEGDRPGEETLRAVEAPRSAPLVFEGIVLGIDGARAAGAVVVTGAGGNAVTKEDGSYRLEVAAPIDAESVQVTAVGAGGSLVASARVAVLPGSTGGSSVVPVAPFVFSPKTCEPGWLPTFGGVPGVSGTILALA